MQRPSSLPSFTPAQVQSLFKAACCRFKKPGIDILLAPALLPHGRILVITSRKVGNAPTRNKIRRRLKAIFYEEKLFEKGHECIAIIKPEGAHTSFEELKKMLLATFEKHQHHEITKKDT
jgi:ribonuclease P protein component